MNEVLSGMLRILLVEDSPAYTRSIQCALELCENLRFQVTTVDSLHAAFVAVEEGAPDVIALDCILRDGIGLRMVQKMCARAPGIPIVVLVPIDEGNLVEQIVRAGARACVFNSDMDGRNLIRAIRRAVETAGCERLQSLPVGKREEVPLLLDTITEGFVTTDLQGDCAFCNPAAVRILGYRSQEDLLGQNLCSLVRGMRSQSNGSRSPEPENRIENVIRTGVPVHVDTEIFWRADGKPFLAEYFASPLRRSDRIVGTVTVLRDITHSRLADDEILDSRERFLRRAHGLIRIAAGRTPEEPNGLDKDDSFILVPEETPWLSRYRSACTRMTRGQ